MTPVEEGLEIARTQEWWGHTGVGPPLLLLPPLAGGSFLSVVFSFMHLRLDSLLMGPLAGL